jgi:peptidoglycan-associated lipoprotein
MKKSLFVVTVSCGLLLVGCAQKEVSKKVKTPTKALDTNRANTNSNINGSRQNVDRYGGDTNGYSYDTGSDIVANNGSVKNIYFDVDKYIITPDKLSTIANNANVLKSDVKAGSRVKIEGHCDATGTDEYNYALGLRRAKAAKEALVSKGIKSSSITMVSMGESSPECTSSYSSSCYSKNRRVEFKVIR